MRIPLKSWIRYTNRLSQISQKAADEMIRYVQSIGGYGGHVEESIQYAYAVAAKYGEAAATAACEMYDAAAAHSGRTLPSAEPAETATYAETARAVQGAGKTSEQLIFPTVERLVKQAAADTTLQNALRDGAEFAWVPRGDTCAFCMMLASRGWQKISKRTLRNGHAEHIHAHCNCEYAVRFDGESTVEGYDPEEYLAVYNDADGNTWQDKVNSMRRDIYAARKNSLSSSTTG